MSVSKILAASQHIYLKQLTREVQSKKTAKSDKCQKKNVLCESYFVCAAQSTE